MAIVRRQPKFLICYRRYLANLRTFHANDGGSSKQEYTTKTNRNNDIKFQPAGVGFIPANLHVFFFFVSPGQPTTYRPPSDVTRCDQKSSKKCVAQRLLPFQRSKAKAHLLNPTQTDAQNWGPSLGFSKNFCRTEMTLAQNRFFGSFPFLEGASSLLKGSSGREHFVSFFLLFFMTFFDCCRCAQSKHAKMRNNLPLPACPRRWLKLEEAHLLWVLFSSQCSRKTRCCRVNHHT